jgi:CRISPR/Cas system CMR-associated protein Cmr5 small subunit
MQNLEQIRADHALKKATILDKKTVSKLPGMIVNNGFLAASAFASDGNRDGLRDVMDAVADHLKGRGLVGSTAGNCKDMIKDLAARSSADLQCATVEALAYLAFLKRFAAKGGEE